MNIRGLPVPAIVAVDAPDLLACFDDGHRALLADLGID
jgi:hypothetical protein